MFRDEIFNLEELERDKKRKKEVDDAVQSSLNSLQKRWGMVDAWDMRDKR